MRCEGRGEAPFRERSEAGWGMILDRLAAVPGRAAGAANRRPSADRPEPGAAAGPERPRGAGAPPATVISLHHRRRCCASSSAFAPSSSGFWRVIVGIIARHRWAGVAPQANGRIVPPCDGKSRRTLLANRLLRVIWRVPSFPSNPRRSAQSRASPRNSARGQPRRRQAGGPIGPPSGGALARSGHVLSETAGAGRASFPTA